MNEAAIPNPALEPFARLIGHWTTTGRHPYMPDMVFHGTVSFTWLHGGAFLVMETAMDEPGIPSGLAVFGSDDAAGQFFMLYFDERGVSRKHDVEIDAHAVVWSRTSAEFSQRFTLTIINDDELVGDGRMSRDGGPWEQDLQLAYKRGKVIDV